MNIGIIGAVNIVVRPYEKSQFVNNNIFSDFLNILNLELTDEFNIHPKIINPGLSRDFMEIKRILNRLLIENNSVFKMLSKYLMTVSAKANNQGTQLEYPLFSYDEKLDIMNRYTEMNKK